MRESGITIPDITAAFAELVKACQAALVEQESITRQQYRAVSLPPLTASDGGFFMPAICPGRQIPGFQPASER